MPSSPKFPYDLPYSRLNLRKHPQLYRQGIGEQGVLSVQPYKSEILPDWKFKTVSIAQKSSQALLRHFNNYLEEQDVVGADMTCKFIQMGVTRARRYANRAGGRKYRVLKAGEDAPKGVKVKVTKNSKGLDVRKVELPKDAVEDPEKAECARVFGVVLDQVKKNGAYIALMKKHHELYDSFDIPSDLSPYLEAGEVKTEEAADVKTESDQETKIAAAPRRSSRTKAKKEESD